MGVGRAICRVSGFCRIIGDTLRDPAGHEGTKYLRGKDPDTGEACFNGPPRASQRRENANHTWFFDDERQPVSAISSKGDDSPPSTPDPEALVHASHGGLGNRPADSLEQAAGLVAGIAKLLSPGLTTFETDRESGVKL